MTDPYTLTDEDHDRVIRVFYEGSREYAREDYQPRREEVESLFLYALAVECTGAPGFYASRDETRGRAAMRAGKAFIVAADSQRS